MTDAGACRERQTNYRHFYELAKREGENESVSRLSRNMRQFKVNCTLKTVERYGTVDDVKMRIKDGKVSLTWR